MTTPTEEYQKLVEEIVQKQSTILGKTVAVRRARNVADLVIDDEGKVTTVPTNINQAFADLVNQYKALSGPVGLNICKQAAITWHNAFPSAILPPILL